MRIITTILALTILLSCNTNDDLNDALAIAGCGVENPLEELDWLKAEIERREQSKNEEMMYCFIVQGEYEGETVFIYQDCNPVINKLIVAINCEGLIALNSEGNAINIGSIENQIIIWKGNNFVCSADF